MSPVDESRASSNLAHVTIFFLLFFFFLFYHFSRAGRGHDLTLCHVTCDERAGYIPTMSLSPLDYFVGMLVTFAPNHSLQLLR
ncbi:hypothetical protein F4824DRAFT_464804 [Ustulina deusta]|nr:hypothetical protein F4824DRAFT_464804 [Ustulina deusta]